MPLRQGHRTLAGENGLAGDRLEWRSFAGAVGVAPADGDERDRDPARAADARVPAGACAELVGAVLADREQAVRQAEVLVPARDLVRDAEASGGEREGVGATAMLDVDAARGEPAVGHQ